MAVGLGAALLPFVGNLFQGAQDAQMNNMNNRMSIAANMHLAEKQYQRQVEFWHMQNQYNSPAEQMKRFGAAGLNPHLIYGQGNPGNASGIPQYHPPNIAYKMASPQIGPALQTVLPTLMQVGTWMQNMKGGAVEIAKNEEILRFLLEKNPRTIQELDNRLSVFPYQKSMMEAKEAIAFETYDALVRENRHKYHEVYGMRAIERAKAMADLKLKELSAEYYEPAMIMRLVTGGVAGLAAAAGLGRIMSTSGKIGQAARKGQKIRETEKIKRVGRERTTTREYWKE